MNDKAFVEIQFGQDSKDLLDNFIKSIIPDEMLYYSPVVEHIRGNMSKTLHCTVFFGLNPTAIDNNDLKIILEKTTLNSLDLGELFYFDGYENLYKILTVKILDTEGELGKLYNKIKEFMLKQNPSFKIRDFQPHLTLAYVKNEFELPEELPELPESISIGKIRVSLVSEFNKSVNS